MTNLGYHCDPEYDGTHHKDCPGSFERYYNYDDSTMLECECYCHKEKK